MSTKPLYLSLDLWIWSTEIFIGFLVKCELRLNGRTADSKWIQCMCARFCVSQSVLNAYTAFMYACCCLVLVLELNQVIMLGFFYFVHSIAWCLRHFALAVICDLHSLYLNVTRRCGRRVKKKWLTVCLISISTALDRVSFFFSLMNNPHRPYWCLLPGQARRCAVSLVFIFDYLIFADFESKLHTCVVCIVYRLRQAFYLGGHN